MTKLTHATAEEAGFDPARIGEIETKAGDWVRAGRMPCVALLVARHGKIVLHRAWGKQSYLPDSPDLTLTL